ncbi:hypothetical protein A2U01_0083933, partial [Trifolium medium]|nr:hypothetical protein [Trifolium medium]
FGDSDCLCVMMPSSIPDMSLGCHANRSTLHLSNLTILSSSEGSRLFPSLLFDEDGCLSIFPSAHLQGLLVLLGNPPWDQDP